MSDLQDKLDRILRPRSGVLSDIHGVRDEEVRLSQLREKMAALFLAQPEVTYEIARLARETFEQGVEELLEIWRSLADGLPEAIRPEQPPADLSSLLLAKTQLQLLEAAPPKDPAGSSAHLQALSRTADFLRTQASSSFYDGRIVAPSAERRRELAQTAVGISQAYRGLQGKFQVLARILADSSPASIRTHLSKGVYRRARQELQLGLEDLQEDLNTPSFSQHVAGILAARAALRVLEEAPELQEFYPLTGNVTAEPLVAPYRGTNAIVKATKMGPYEMGASSTVVVTLGLESETLTLPASALPRLDGVLAEVWGDQTDETGSAAPYNTVGAQDFQIYLEKVDGTRVDATAILPSDAALSIAATVLYLNTLWTGLGIGAVLQASDSAGSLRIQALTGSFTLGSGTGNTALGFTPGGGFTLTAASLGTFTCPAGPYDLSGGANGLLIYLRNPLTGTSVLIQPALPTGAAEAALAVATAIQQAIDLAGFSAEYSAVDLGPNLVLRAQVGSAHQMVVASGSALTPLGIPSETLIQGKDASRTLDMELNGAPVSVTLSAGTYSALTLRDLLQAALGSDYTVFAAGSAGRRLVSVAYSGPNSGSSRLSVPELPQGMGHYLRFPIGLEVAGFPLRGSTLASFLQAQSLLSFVTELFVERAALTLRTISGDATQVYLYTVEGSGALEVLGATTGRITPRPAELAEGDLLRLTSGPQAGTLWTVTEPGESSFKITSALTPIAQAEVSWIAAPDPGLAEGWVIKLEDETFVIREVLDELRVDLDRTPLPSFLPDIQEAPVLVGQEAVQFQGRSALTLSLGPNTYLFLPFSALTATPTTSWLRLPGECRAVPEDVFEVIPGGQTVPTETYLIGRVEEDGEILQVDGSFSTTYSAAINGDAYSSSTRARIRNHRHTLLLELLRGCADWLTVALTVSKEVDQAKAAIAAILSRKEAPYVLVSSALVKIQVVVDRLEALLATLQAYTVEKGPLLDRVRSFLDQAGADGLVQALENGDISSLFTGPATLGAAAFSSLQEVQREFLEQPQENRDLYSRPISSTVEQDDDDLDAVYAGEQDEGLTDAEVDGTFDGA
jgi:hypothetical protein